MSMLDFGKWREKKENLYVVYRAASCELRDKKVEVARILNIAECVGEKHENLPNLDIYKLSPSAFAAAASKSPID